MNLGEAALLGLVGTVAVEGSKTLHDLMPASWRPLLRWALGALVAIALYSWLKRRR